MATHSSVLAWRIPGTGEPVGLSSMWSHRVGHNWSDLAAAAAAAAFSPWVGKIPWRREWQPTPVFLPEEFHGQRSLAGCSSWGREESDTTEWLPFHFLLSCTGEGNGNPFQRSCLEPGGLPSMGSHRVGHDWSDLAAASTILNNYERISHREICLLPSSLKGVYRSYTASKLIQILAVWL